MPPPVTRCPPQPVPSNPFQNELSLDFVAAEDATPSQYRGLPQGMRTSVETLAECEGALDYRTTAAWRDRG